jgi:hypothetical protein
VLDGICTFSLPQNLFDVSNCHISETTICNEINNTDHTYLKSGLADFDVFISCNVMDMQHHTLSNISHVTASGTTAILVFN